MPVTIVQKGDPVLGKRAEDVPVSEITSKRIKEIIADMKEALDGEEDGAAIAAPQIGVPLRIFVVSGRILKKTDDDNEATPPDITFINPILTKVSKTKRLIDEGCLSVRGQYGMIERATKATVQAYDEWGKSFMRGGSGLLAQVFQHECDHLEGILFIEKTKETWKVPPPRKNIAKK
jgi:peptide deformylase